MRSFARTLALVAGAFLATGSAGAQGWFTLPNGKQAYLLDYTTTGVFQCPGPGYIGIGTCEANGSSLTIRNGTAAMTVSYAGVSQSHVAILGQAVGMPLGRLTRTFSGTPFTPKVPFPPRTDYFYFGLMLNSMSPISMFGAWNGVYQYTPNGFAGNIWALYGLPLTPSTPPGYTTLSFGRLNAPDFSYSGDATYDLFAPTYITPEPATRALLATGLFGVGGATFRRWKRRRIGG